MRSNRRHARRAPLAQDTVMRRVLNDPFKQDHDGAHGPICSGGLRPAVTAAALVFGWALGFSHVKLTRRPDKTAKPPRLRPATYPYEFEQLGDLLRRWSPDNPDGNVQKPTTERVPRYNYSDPWERSTAELLRDAGEKLGSTSWVYDHRQPGPSEAADQDQIL